MFSSAAELEPSPHGLSFYNQLLGLSFFVRIGCCLARLASTYVKIGKCGTKVLRIRFQSRLELDPMLTYMDFIGGREKCQNLYALLFSSLRIVRLYDRGVGRPEFFDWDSRVSGKAPGFTVMGQTK